MSLANRVLIEKKLTYQERKRLKTTSFVYPKEKKYPIHDLAHGRNALARVSAFGSPAEKARVKSEVYKKYPALKKNALERGKIISITPRRMAACEDKRDINNLVEDLVKLRKELCK